jgi:hypothetical protein
MLWSRSETCSVPYELLLATHASQCETAGMLTLRAQHRQGETSHWIAAPREAVSIGLISISHSAIGV